MRAVTIPEYGDPDVMRVAELADPEPGEGQIRIRVAGASVNPADVGIRSGRASGAIADPVFPLVPGWDVAGVVDAVGPGVTRFQTGQAVVGLSVWFVTRRGTHAEFVVLDEAACAAAPATASLVAAATLPLNGLTAWSALAVAKAGPGDRLLVTGAAGAVGGFLVELARSRGIEVIGHARAADREAVLAFGAAEFVDDLSKVTGVAFAVDTTADPGAVLPAMADDGRLVTVAGPAADVPAGITAKAAYVRADADALTSLVAMVDDGTLTLRPGDTYQLENAPEAHRRLSAGGLRTRLVLVP